MEWQPIETAPKDGTVVDLWIAAAGCQFRAPDFKFRNGRWEGKTSDEPLEWHYMNVGMCPTHWTPSPARPSNTISQAQKGKDKDMWITTLDGQWLIHEIRGVVYTSWVQRKDKAHAAVFPENLCNQWLETMKKSTGREDLVLEKP